MANVTITGRYVSKPFVPGAFVGQSGVSLGNRTSRGVGTSSSLENYYTKIQSDALYVHLIGDESIAGVKTFTDAIVMSNATNPYIRFTKTGGTARSFDIQITDNLYITDVTGSKHGLTILGTSVFVGIGNNATPDSMLHVIGTDGATLKIGYGATGENYYWGSSHIFAGINGTNNIVTLADKLIKFGITPNDDPNTTYSSIYTGGFNLIYRNAYDCYIAGNAYLSTVPNWKASYTGYGSTMIEMADGNFKFNTAPDGTANTATTFTERFFILENGNVGITPNVASVLKVGYYNGTYPDAYIDAYAASGDIGFKFRTLVSDTPTIKFEITSAGAATFYGDITAPADIGTATFVSGFAGSGWKLDNSTDVSLTVDHLTVRKRANFFEVVIKRITSVNGGLMITAGNGKVDHVGTPDTYIYFDTDEGSNPIQFAVNDIVESQHWSGREGVGGVAYYQAIVDAVHQYTEELGAYIRVTHIDGLPWDGMELYQAGNTTDTDRQSMIYLTSTDDNNPYIDGYTGVDDGRGSGDLKFRLGNLTGITDVDFAGIGDADSSGALSGFGLYSNNIYLKGSVNITDGAMTGGTVSGFTVDANSLSFADGVKHIVLTNVEAVDPGYGRGLTIYKSDETSVSTKLVAMGQIHKLDSTEFIEDSFDVPDYGFEIMSGADTHLVRFGTGTNLIGGWTITGTTIKDTGGYTGMSSAVVGVGDIRFWAGHATPASAPFRVTKEGAITATSGSIAGWTLATDAIYNGTKSTGDGYNEDSSGGITLAADGSIHAPNFYLNADGNVGAREITIYSKTGTVDSESQQLGIVNNGIWENAYNGDGSSVDINRKGHLGSTDHYRNLKVWDGKGYMIANFAGAAIPVLTSYGQFVVEEGLRRTHRSIVGQNGTADTRDNHLVFSVLDADYTCYLPQYPANGQVLTISNFEADDFIVEITSQYHDFIAAGTVGIGMDLYHYHSVTIIFINGTGLDAWFVISYY